MGSGWGRSCTLLGASRGAIQGGSNPREIINWSDQECRMAGTGSSHQPERQEAILRILR
jgi:hypothetical protein